MPSGCKNWCWTLNNYSQTTYDHLVQLGESCRDQETISYIVFGKEVGEQGTPHLQGFVQFCSRVTLKKVKSILQDNTIHLEQMKGTAEQAADYCKKDKDFREFGEITKKGQRKDLDLIKKEIDSGASYATLWDNHFSTMVQYRKGFQEYLFLKRSKQARDPPRVLVFYGVTGTGKTRRAWAINPNSTWVYPGKGWFDGYNGEDVAIFDEFDGEDIQFAFWKQLVDRYPINVPIKGGYVPWCPKVIVFTSNLPTDLWWRNERLPDGHRAQFARRVERTVEMNVAWNPEEDPLLFD